LILDGWQGWEAVEISRDKEISVVVEVEVEVEDEMMPVPQEDPIEAPTPTNDTRVSSSPPETTEEEGGWGFDEDTQQSAQAGPSSPKRNGQSDDMDDGWAFDDDLSAPSPAPAPVVAPKPTREAKKLGKRVAKAKVPEPGDENEDDNMQGSVHTESSNHDLTEPSSMPPPPVPATNESMDWAWDDDKTTAKNEAKPKAKRKELKEEKRTIKETFLVSKACETLLHLAEDVLQDSQEIQSE
jgi:centromere/kinetochore protein ZW10